MALRAAAVAVAFWLAASPAIASGHDWIVERAWFEDPTGQMDWQEAQRQPLQAFSYLLTRGYSDKPLWIRLRVDPARFPVPAGESLYLRVRPGYLDEVLVFDPLQSPPQRQPLGDRHPVSHQGEHSVTFVHTIPAGDAPRDIWLRVQTETARMVYPEVLTHDAFHSSDAPLPMLGTLYLGLIALFVLWGIVQSALRPEPILFTYVAYMAAAFGSGFSVLGFGRLFFSDYIDPAWLNGATNLLVIVQSGLGVLFAHFLIGEMSPARWPARMVLAFSAVFPLLMLGLLVGESFLMLRINMTLVLLLPLILVVLATWLLAQSTLERRKHRPELPRTGIWLYFMVGCLFAVLTALPALGVLDAGIFSLYAIFFYSVCTGLLMLVMLQYRAWYQVLEEVRLRSVANEAVAVARQEQGAREERERLLMMLGHELKTPLATLRMLLANHAIPRPSAEHMDAVVTDMVSVLERSVHAGRLEAGRVDLRVESVDVEALIRGLPRDLNADGRITIGPAASAPAIAHADNDLLKVIVRNLLDNALKYSPPGSPVKVDVRWPHSGDAWWELTVSNAPGRAGMPDPLQVFTKYYRSPQAGHQNGSGLGLFLVRQLAELMQGQLQYRPDASEVVFHLRMPTGTLGDAR